LYWLERVIMFGKNNKGSNTIHCLTIGEDKKLMHRTLESTGTFLLDSRNIMAYDSFPQCMANFSTTIRGHQKYRGMTSLLYENMARPFSFKTLTWVRVAHKKDQIKAVALSEGCSKAVQRINLEDRFNKMWTLALLAVAGVIGLALLFAFQSGLFSNIFG
jgi:hypothetical protein